MVKYHVKTPHGVVTRTSKRQLEPQFTHIVVYNGNTGVPGLGGSTKPIPSFHGSEQLARRAASASWTKTTVVYPITESDYTVEAGKLTTKTVTGRISGDGPGNITEVER